MGKFIPPDWRDASRYDMTTEKYNLSQWAWEFLRRNPEYQEDYERFDKLPSYNPNGSKTEKWYSTEAVWWSDPSLRYCKYPLLEYEDTIAEYFYRTGDDFPFNYSLEDHLIEKWGIPSTEIYDLAHDGGGIGFVTEPEYPKLICISDQNKDDGYYQRPIESDNVFTVTLRFDVRHPIDRQLEDAKEELHIIREALIENVFFDDLNSEQINKQYKHHIKNFPIYLIAYDGKCAGASPSEMGGIICPKLDPASSKKRISDAVKKATEYIQGGYKTLIDNV
ncbi:MAG: DUF6499 domain-containing protein [Nitrosomonas sp.]